MRGVLLGLFALLSAGAAQAESASAPYAVAGDWKIDAVKQGICGMSRFYPAGAKYGAEGLIIFYDAQRKGAVLTWVSWKPKLPPLSDSLDLDLRFFGGAAKSGLWGSQPFQTEKRADSYGFTHAFAGSTDSERFLHDLAEHDTFALFFGPALMTGLRLNASEAVTKLRECSSKIAAQGSPGDLPR